MSIYDVVVIGRGLIGSATARHLVKNGELVCLIGPGEPVNHRTLTGVFGSHYDSGRIVRVLQLHPHCQTSHPTFSAICENRPVPVP